jgi:hypothetical protein
MYPDAGHGFLIRYPAEFAAQLRRGEPYREAVAPGDRAAVRRRASPADGGVADDGQFRGRVPVYDLTNGWEGNHPMRVPCFVVTHDVPTDVIDVERWTAPGLVRNERHRMCVS